jgi:hypothetical protein
LEVTVEVGCVASRVFAGARDASVRGVAVLHEVVAAVTGTTNDDSRDRCSNGGTSTATTAADAARPGLVPAEDESVTTVARTAAGSEGTAIRELTGWEVGAGGASATNGVTVPAADAGDAPSDMVGDAMSQGPSAAVAAGAKDTGAGASLSTEIAAVEGDD